MWNPFKNTPNSEHETLTLKLNGMHCVSCALNIDGELEDTPGVHSAQTVFAKGVTTVTYHPDTVDRTKIVSVIEKLGYRVEA